MPISLGCSPPHSSGLSAGSEEARQPGQAEGGNPVFGCCVTPSPAPFGGMPPPPRGGTHLPATPAHFIGCFFRTTCAPASGWPCKAIDDVGEASGYLRIPAPEGASNRGISCQATAKFGGKEKTPNQASNSGHETEFGRIWCLGKTMNSSSVAKPV